MPPRRGRPRKGDRRIDAAIDHFAVMGYAPRDVRTVINRLFKLYGSADAWPLLEEGSYQLVLDLLIEKQEEEEKQQLLLLEHHPQSEELLEHHPQSVELLEHQSEVAQEPPQHQGPAEDETPPENNMALLEVHNEVSAEPDSPDEGMEEDHAFAEPPALQALVPYPIAMQTHGPVRPCYGWISESDDDEEEITDQQPEGHVLSVGGSHY